MRRRISTIFLAALLAAGALGASAGGASAIGQTIRVFNNQFRNAAGGWRDFGGNQPNLVGQAGPCPSFFLMNWNDCISSWHIFNANNKVLTVEFWTDVDYRGLVHRVQVAPQGQLWDNIANHDNRYSSIRIILPPG